MATPVLDSISPVLGAPGTAITLVGSGFDSAAQVACPTLVDTTFVSATELTAVIPETLEGPSGGTMLVAVFVRNADGSASGMQQFTVQFPAVDLQAWASIEQVTGEVPGFERGGQISDNTIRNWIRSISQAVNAAMLRRGLPLDPAEWQQATAVTATPSPAAILEQIVRLGAAARLAAAVGGQFSQTAEWPLAKNLQTAYQAEMKALLDGEYDKAFRPEAVTIESGTVAFGGSAETTGGDSTQVFTKEKVF